MDFYYYLKSLHLIFVVTWFAGLFYIVRLFVYQIEAHAKPSPEREILLTQYKLMSKRLWYIITWPSAVLTAIFALWMLFFTDLGNVWLKTSWMHLKLAFVVILYIYHFRCHRIYTLHQNDEFRYTSNYMRIWNEGATLLLFAIVFIVVLKSAFDWIFGVIGIILLSVMLMLGYRIYKRIRER